MPQEKFALTYATMFNPPEELHTNYEQALARVKAGLGAEHAMFINGRDHYARRKFESRSPINRNWLLGKFQAGGAQDAQLAIDAAAAAFPAWAATPWQQRATILRRAASIIEERVYDIAAALSLNIGKNRMEALGDAQEAADFFTFACDSLEQHAGFATTMRKDPLVGFNVTNVSTLQPYGVWVVITPFNFPCALTCGPTAAALAAGNTVVFKSAPEAPWIGRLVAECLRDAGLPAGTFNFVSDSDSKVARALVRDPRVAGITFTGSYEVGMQIYRTFARGPYPRPVILEMGGKNPVIVTADANLDDAAVGIVRSAFGLQGQKCSANSRVYAHHSIKKVLVGKMAALAKQLTIGDPTVRENFLGPVIHRAAYDAYRGHAQKLQRAADIVTGGKQLTQGELADGYYCAPTIADNVPLTNRLWQHEMFLPITMVTGIASFAEGLAHANATPYGLTAGVYGSEAEAQQFFAQVQAGVAYANRPQGSTTGAWPGFQPFGGWKASGSTGKNAGGPYYLQLYMHEQVHCMVRRG